MTDIVTIESSAFPTARVAAFEGFEALGEPFRYTVWLLVPEADALALDVDTAMLGRTSLHWVRADGSPRATVHGVLGAIEMLDEAPTGDALYRIEIVPTFQKLAMSRHGRVWVDMTVPDILRELFGLGGLGGDDFNLDSLRARYEPRTHVCQYRESDFAFASRWMEREGIYYLFDQSGSGDKVVLHDLRDSHADPTQTLHIVPEVGAGSGSEGLRGLDEARNCTAGPMTLVDRDPLRPTVQLRSNATIDPARTTAVVRHMEDDFLTSGTGDRLATVRAQALHARAAMYRGQGLVFGLSPGQVFEVVDHPRPALNRGFQCVAIRTYGRMAPGDHALDRFVPTFHGRTHWVEVTAIPDDVQFRSLERTPRPRVTGHEIGHVDGPIESEYAQIDENGRYRVRLHFDERVSPDGGHSTWVRMAQPHAGNPEGMHFPLRKHTEVSVMFIAGDPDRPVIAGALPDAERPSPVVQANHTQNVIETGGRSRIEIEDLDGAQYIDVSTPPENTFMHLGALHGSHDHNYISSTDGNGLLHTGGNLDVTVGGAKHEHVVRTLDEKYHGTLTTKVTGTVTEHHHTNMTTTVTGDVTETAATHITHVKGHKIEHCASQGTTVTGHLEEHHGAQKTDVDNRLYVHSGTHLSTASLSTCDYKTLLIQASASITITCTGSFNITATNWQDNAPIAYQRVTTQYNKVVGGSWITVHPVFIEAYGSKTGTTTCAISLNRWKLDIGGVSLGFNGGKIDITKSKFDAWGAKMKFDPLKAVKASQKTYGFAFALFA